MKAILAVLNNQYKKSKREKGMQLFYGFTILLLGVVAPILSHDIQSLLIMIVFFTIMLEKPILADCIAMEREQKTLEPLLSCPISIRQFLTGKFLYSFLFSILYFLLCIMISLITRYFLGLEGMLTLEQLILITVSVISTLFSISWIGTYQSAKASDVHTANSKVGGSSYFYSILLAMYFAVVFLNVAYATLVISIIFFSLQIVVLFLFGRKLIVMNQSDFYEHLTYKKNRKQKEQSYDCSVRHYSSFTALVRHEIKYLSTLKTLLLNFLLLIFSPAIILCLARYYGHSFDLSYAIMILAFMMPRIPTNLVAYSIGGEKAYKTGESLLTTPLKTQTLLMAKSFLPIIVSILMITCSSLLVLLAMPLYNVLTHSNDLIPSFTLTQWMLIFPVNILSCILMIFIAATLSLVLKTPRQGLYATSFLGFTFVLPIACILYVVTNPMLWTIIYLGVLLFAILSFYLLIRNKIARPALIMRL